MAGLNPRLKIKLMFPAVIFIISFVAFTSYGFADYWYLALFPSIVILITGLNKRDWHELKAWARPGREEKTETTGEGKPAEKPVEKKEEKAQWI